MRFAYSIPLFALFFVGGRRLAAQSATPVQDTVPPPSAARAESRAPRAPWLTSQDAKLLGAAAVATIIVAPFDHPISNKLGEPRYRHASSLQRAAKTVAVFGGDGPFVGSGVLYAVGTIGGGDGGGRLGIMASAALHNVEAIALATGVNGLAKGLAGRALPGVDARHAFSFGRGFHDGNGPFVSFPSGHTAAAFAMAATLSGEIHNVDPDLASRVTPLIFAGAASVGVARVVQHVHWPSDLPLAAAIGTWSGHVVQAHVHSRGTAATALRGLTVSPAAGQRTLIGWSSLVAAGGQ
jgi:membrane-associated phospholipid phosphatase